MLDFKDRVDYDLSNIHVYNIMWALSINFDLRIVLVRVYPSVISRRGIQIDFERSEGRYIFFLSVSINNSSAKVDFVFISTKRCSSGVILERISQVCKVD